MSLTKDIGYLLISIDNAIQTVFGDEAFVTHIIPSPNYNKDGVILDITISIFKSKCKNYDTKLKIFDELIYNPIFHSDKTLSKVNITIKEL